VVASLERPDGARLAYEVAGDPRRPALLLIGGVGGDRSTWRHVVPLLAAERFVVVADPRGVGGSTSARDERATVSTYVEDAVAVLDELRIERASVYGHSFGGMVALEVALAHPERVDTVIVGSTRPGRADAVSSSRKAPLGRPWEILYSERFLAEHADVVDEDRRVVARNHAGERRQGLAARAWDPGDRLSAIRAPVLILHGSEDRLVDVANAARLAAKLGDAEVVVLEGAGHAYHSEMPERSSELVLDFLRRPRTEP
jgi:pimeloyl-ACP methyl ester carboxylesterase